MENTPFASLYRWDQTDEKQKTIIEMANNSQKIDTMLNKQDEQLQTIDSTLVTVDERINNTNSLIQKSIADAAISVDVSKQSDVKSTEALEKSNVAKTTAETVRDELNHVIAEAGSNNPEVVQARGGEANLNARLNGFNQQLAETEQEVIDLQKSKIDKSNAVTKLELSSKADKDEIFSMRNMGQDIKEAMTGGSVAIVGVNTILEENIIDKQVTPEKTDFTVIGKNLFNKNNVEFGKNIASSGAITSNESYALTKFISVNPNTGYAKNVNGSLCFYDGNYRYISGLSSTSRAFTTPTNARYIRAAFSINNLDIAQIELGSVQTPYEPFRVRLKGFETVGNKDLETDSVRNENIKDKEVTIEKTDFVEIGKNLFNKNNIKKDAQLASSGSITEPYPGHNISGYIKIKPNTNYYRSSERASLCFYDVNYTYIYGIKESEGIKAFKTPLTARHLRTGVRTEHLNNFQLEEGTEGTQYEKFHYKFTESFDTPSGSSPDELVLGRTLLNGARAEIFKHNANKKFLNFGYITDTHVNGNLTNFGSAVNNMKLFKEFCNEKFIDFASHGGDIHTALGLKNKEAMQVIGKATSVLGEIQQPLFYVKGNHDTNGQYPSTTELDNSERISDAQFFLLTELTLKDVVFNEKDRYGGYFYRDFEDERIRVIVLNYYDTGIGQEQGIHNSQLKFLCENALVFEGKDVPNGWSVLFLCHENPTGKAPAFLTLLDAFIHGESIEQSAYSYDYSRQGGLPVIGVIHGHQHSDLINTSQGYPIVGVTRGYALINEVGTEAEYCFSIFTVDTDNRKLYETRIGRGTNREFSY